MIAGWHPPPEDAFSTPAATTRMKWQKNGLLRHGLSPTCPDIRHNRTPTVCPGLYRKNGKKRRRPSKPKTPRGETVLKGRSHTRRHTIAHVMLAVFQNQKKKSALKFTNYPDISKTYDEKRKLSFKQQKWFGCGTNCLTVEELCTRTYSREEVEAIVVRVNAYATRWGRQKTRPASSKLLSLFSPTPVPFVDVRTSDELNHSFLILQPLPASLWSKRT